MGCKLSWRLGDVKLSSIALMEHNCKADDEIGNLKMPFLKFNFYNHIIKMDFLRLCKNNILKTI